MAPLPAQTGPPTPQLTPGTPLGPQPSQYLTLSPTPTTPESLLTSQTTTPQGVGCKYRIMEPARMRALTSEGFWPQVW